MNRRIRYIGSSVFVLAILAAPVIHGFRAWLAARPDFGRTIIEDREVVGGYSQWESRLPSGTIISSFGAHLARSRDQGSWQIRAAREPEYRIIVQKISS